MVEGAILPKLPSIHCAWNWHHSKVSYLLIILSLYCISFSICFEIFARKMSVKSMKKVSGPKKYLMQRIIILLLEIKGCRNISTSKFSSLKKKPWHPGNENRCLFLKLKRHVTQKQTRGKRQQYRLHSSNTKKTNMADGPTDERKHLWSRVGKSILLMMKTRAVVVKKDENGKRVYELRESVRGTSENIYRTLSWLWVWHVKLLFKSCRCSKFCLI